MRWRLRTRSLVIVTTCAVVVAVVSGFTSVGAATNWLSSLVGGSKGEGASRSVITTATTNPVTFTAACTSPSTAESAKLTWTAAGSSLSGYQVWQSTTANGTYTQAGSTLTGATLTVTLTYTSAANTIGGTGNKYYRLEAASTNWTYSGATITNAREATEGATLNGFLVMASSGTQCVVN
jgi:hypothetical protein